MGIIDIYELLDVVVSGDYDALQQNAALRIKTKLWFYRRLIDITVSLLLGEGTFMHRSLQTHLTHAIRQDATYRLVDTLADLTFVAVRVVLTGFSAVFRQIAENKPDQQRVS